MRKMAVKTGGTKYRTKLRVEFRNDGKVHEEKGTPSGETKEKEAARLEISGELDSFMEKMLRKYTEETEKLKNETKEERRAWEEEREKKRAEWEKEKR